MWLNSSKFQYHLADCVVIVQSHKSRLEKISSSEFLQVANEAEHPQCLQVSSRAI